MSQRWLQPLLILGLGLLFFAPLVLHPTAVLYSDHSDFLAEHLPAKRFLVHSLHESGELPLWCPYTFSGSPFVHDIQVGMFYPLHWPLYWLPEEAVGPGLSWLIVLHVILAGWCTLAYARSQGLHGWGALAAATGYMFAGRWLLHVLGGGFYVLIALTWLPLVLLFLERAIDRGSALWATVAGIFFALIILNTHPQWTFYAGVFVALWTLGAALERAGFYADGKARTWKRICKSVGVWFLCGSWAALVAVGLAAVQLLPTLEAAAYSSRSAGVDNSGAVGGGLRALLFMIGPTLVSEPFNLEWEDRGGFGVLWIFMAAMAPLLGRGRVRFQVGVCVALFLFAFGGAALLQPLPGFRLFRQPARMLVVAGLPVAFLAGSAVQSLCAAAHQQVEVQQRGRRVLVRVLIGAAILCGGFALLQGLVRQKSLTFHPYWLTLLVTVPAAFWLLSKRKVRFAWWLVLLIDLWGLALPLVVVRSEALIYNPSACVDHLRDLDSSNSRILDSDNEQNHSCSPLGEGAPLALTNRLEAVRGYTPLDVLRYKEYLQFIGDKDDPLVPFENALTFPAIGNVTVENRNLLDLMGVRYLLQPADTALPGTGWQLRYTDANPMAYDFIAGGMRRLGPYALYENDNVLPRAFLVRHASPLPERTQVLAALKGTDFRRHVWLEDGAPEMEEPVIPENTNASVASIAEYQSNRVVVNVAAAAPAYLVLADVWYPGWNCTVNGEPAKVHRANYLFRAVYVPQGDSRVEFTFQPQSYERGKRISLLGILVVIGVGAIGLARWIQQDRLRNRVRPTGSV